MKSDTAVLDIQRDLIAIESIPIISNIFEVICRTTGMGFAAIARVTDDKWIACSVRDEIAFGLKPGGELVLETTICNEIRQNHQPVVIDHVEQDSIFSTHHTPAMYGFQSYISIPIIKKDGSFFGTLCAIDPKPAKLNNPETIGMFKLFAELISFHLASFEELVQTQSRFLAEQRTAELREQFIAILGHDLRNPVSAIQMGAELLLQFPLEEGIKEIARVIKNSSSRISGLIENILDFARGRLGAGIVLNSHDSSTLTSMLNQIVSELQTINPGRIIETSFEIHIPVYCDENRIAQLFSNLLGNAILHGDKNAPIKINASVKKDLFILTVTNSGKQIPADTLEIVFQPFHKGDREGNKGLGLGLYIAAEIAKAHQGKLIAASTVEETSFTLEIPVYKKEKSNVALQDGAFK